MRVVAVVPFWSQSDAVNWDSNYNLMRRVLPVMSDLRPEWIWVLFWPIAEAGMDKWTYYKDGFFDSMPRLVKFGWPYDTAMRTSIRGFHPTLLKRLENQWGPSIIWLNQVEMGAQLVGGYRDAMVKDGRPTMIAQQHYIIHKSLPYPFETMISRLLLQMIGSLCSDAVVTNSEWCRTMMRESFSLYLNANAMAELADKTHILQFGMVDEAKEPPPLPDAKPGDTPIVIYNHRFEGYKNHHVTAQVLRDLRAAGNNFEVWITQAVDQNIGEFPCDKFIGHPDVDRYLNNLNVPAINTLNSQHETFCIALLDSIMMGNLPVAPNSVTFPELVPEGYPFLFNSEKEQRAMLEGIFKRWPADWQEWAPKLREHARTKFGIKSYAQRYIELFERYSQATATMKPHTAVNRERTVGLLPKSWTPWPKVWRMVKAEMGLQDQSLTPTRFQHLFGPHLDASIRDGELWLRANGS
jgi:glycosyltransferase involved in cell wall biosynthesis